MATLLEDVDYQREVAVLSDSDLINRFIQDCELEREDHACICAREMGRRNLEY